MRVPLSWLKDYIDLQTPLDDILGRLTLAGLEVAEIEHIGDWWDPSALVVGQVLAVQPHPNADRLVLVDIDYGAAEPQRVVTGAPNLFIYRESREPLPVIKVAFAREGAWLIDGYTDEVPRPKKQLKAAKIRGVASSGMVCSERELGISDDHEGILILPSDAPLGTPLRDYLGDTVVELELTVDMIHCLCMIGVASEISALTGDPVRAPADDAQTAGDDNANDYVDLEIANPDLCNRYTGIILRDVKIGPSPLWMQDRLRKAGMRPINNIVDITNYVMLEWGQPLHAFDYDVLAQRAKQSNTSKPTIIVRRANVGEKMTTLDGIERELDESMLLITDTLGPIAIAGIMGGAETEVHEGTTNVFLESATFDNISNRRTSQRLRLISEASRRFTRGIPATLNPIGGRRAAELMRLYGNARIVPGMVDAYPVPQEQRVIYTTESDVRRLLGIPVTLEQIKDVLSRRDFKVETLAAVPATVGKQATFGLHIIPGEPVLACSVPWHRLDMRFPADLAEDVARTIGYDQIPPTLIDDVLPTQRRDSTLEIEDRMRDILTRCGLQEIISHPMTTPDLHTALGLPDGPYVTLANPLTPRRSIMRRSMLVTAVDNMLSSLRYINRIGSFEIGRVYLPEKGDTLRPQEDRRLSILLSGPRTPGELHRAADSEPMDFFDLKGVIEALFDRMGIDATQVSYAPNNEHPSFGSRAADILLNGEIIGTFGELHPRVRAALGLPDTRVNVAEIRIAPLIRPVWAVVNLRSMSDYPPVVEDLAFVVPETVSARSMLDALRAGGGEMLINAEVFDVYRGAPLPSNTKSLAWRVTYQRTDRTLSETDVAALRERIVGEVVKQTGATLRGG